ncbi:MAG TPA: 2-amino-4-hydroxy-6-hydroxymethyldihydropteridine diphosphokinase [Candidatus Eremiobacteraceae bacterium]
MKPVLAHIGLGSNMCDSAGYVREGLAALERVGRVLAVSDLYLTQPWGLIDQPRFVNAVAAVETTLTPPRLVDALIGIEREFGRVRDVRYGPRTIDLDLLLYADESLDEAACIVPHPQLANRAFVLEPLAEVASGTRVPGTGKTVGELLLALPLADRQGVRRMSGTAHLAPPRSLDYDAPGGAGDAYAELRPFSAFDTAVLDAAISALGSLNGKLVLDVGCGTGRFTRAMAARGARVSGVDKSETMLAAARATKFAEDGIPPDYIRGDANVALPGGNYDAITAFYALQYLDVPAFCHRACAALAPGGALSLASFPHRHFVESEFAPFFPSMAALDLARFPSLQQLEAAMRRADFARVDARLIALELDDPAEAIIAKVQRKYLSSFHLLSDEEFRDGVAAMRKTWQPGEIVRRTAYAMVVWGTRRTGSPVRQRETDARDR